MKMNDIYEYLDFLFPDPKGELVYNSDFDLLIAIVLSAQTTDKKVNMVTKNLFSKYDSNTLMNADIDDLKHILKPLGMNDKKSLYIKEISKILKEKYNGIIPDDIDALMTLPGVGKKTANLVLAILYNKPYFAVDTHVERVSKRLGLVSKNDNSVKIENKLYKLVDSDRILKTHHQFVLFGRYYCKSIKPLCDNCKLKNICKKDLL